METPEFLAWAIEFTCPIRGEQDGSDPERTERQLRAARATSDARHENRVFEGLAVDPPYGFRVADALAIYGGESAVASACRECPANCGPPLHYAGCHGLVPLTPTAHELHAAAEQIIEQLGLSDKVSELFPATSPRWYALWMSSPLSAEQLAVVQPLVTAIGLTDLAAGCATALAANRPLHVRLYPPGKVEGIWWRLVPHCPRCKAACLPASGRLQPPDGVDEYALESHRGAHAPRSPRCPVCGYVGHPAPDKKRSVRGRRPYARLDHALGEGQSTEFLARYFDFQMRQQSPDRA